MEVFTIVANEVIGLSATECTLIQFSYNPEQIRDPETVLAVLSRTISRRMKANDSWKSTVVAGTGAMSMTFLARSS